MSGMPEIDCEVAPEYKIINVAGLLGGARPGGVQVVLYSETMNVQKTLKTEPLQPERMIIKRIAECELRIDPLQMKSIHMWLELQIKEYEQLYGTILSPEEIESRKRRT